MSYSYNYDSYSKYPSYNSPKTRKPPSLWLIVLVFVIVALLEYCKRVCREEQQEEEARAQQQQQQQPSSQTAPRVAIISEMSNRQTHTRPVQFVCYSGTEEHETTAGRLAQAPQAPESSTSSRPPVRSDSVPQYDSPPNYEEALALLNVNQKQKDRDTPIT